MKPPTLILLAFLLCVTSFYAGLSYDRQRADNTKHSDGSHSDAHSHEPLENDLAREFSMEGASLDRVRPHLLVHALIYYRIVMGDNPTGDNAAIAAALMGRNPANRKFIEWPRRDLSETGEFLDAWGVAYNIDIKGNVFTVSSAGRDQIFGTKDDIVERKKRKEFNLDENLRP